LVGHVARFEVRYNLLVLEIALSVKVIFNLNTKVNKKHL